MYIRRQSELAYDICEDDSQDQDPGSSAPHLQAKYNCI